MKRISIPSLIMTVLFAIFIFSPLQFGTSKSGIVAKAACELTSEQIVNYFSSRVGESYTSNACLAFVADGFQALGAERSSACCAYNYGLSHLSSTSRDIPIGADVFFTSEGCKYDYIDGNGHHSGHIGVYVGDGYIVHSYSSKIQKMLISTVESHGYTYWGWGYHGGISIIDGKFFDFWGVEDGVTVAGTYKVWLKQVGLGNANNSDVNLYIDGKELENCLGTLHQDDNGFYSFEINTLEYESGEHTLYAVFRNTSDVEIWKSKVIKIGNPQIAIDHLSGGIGEFNISGWIADGVDWTSSCEAYIYVGGDCVAHFVADTPSDDVGNHRYNQTIETKYYGDLTLKIDAVDPIRGTIKTVYRDVTITPKNPQLAIDHLSGGVGVISIAGWAADGYDWKTTCEVNIYVGEDQIAHFVADTPSEDVGTHRFSKIIKTYYRGEQTLHIEAIDQERNTSVSVERSVIISAQKGDCNGDGETTVLDVVQLQKWILQVSNATIKDSNAADLNGDGVVDVFDLGLLKRDILAKKS